MKEYDTFSLEEHGRAWADYMANRKGPRNVMTAPGNTSATGLFGASPNQTALATGGLFGANTSQVNATFGETTGSSTTVFGFGSTSSTSTFAHATSGFNAGGFWPIPNKDHDQQSPCPQLPSGSECSTCYGPRARTFALLPCGHATFCGKCATYFSESSAKRCPTCRAKITGVVRLFL